MDCGPVDLVVVLVEPFLWEFIRKEVKIRANLHIVLFTSIGGVITTNQVSLSSSSFLGDPPTFTLIGETRGGPPTLYTWTRNAGQITNSSSFSISISVKSSAVERFRESVYVSTLVVRGNLPGVYQYSVTNRAMTNSRINGSLSIEGGAGVRNLMAVQTGLAGVRVSWTAPPLKFLSEATRSPPPTPMKPHQQPHTMST